jgi:protein tyrosine/serine phosphatase
VEIQETRLPSFFRFLRVAALLATLCVTPVVGSTPTASPNSLQSRNPSAAPGANAEKLRIKGVHNAGRISDVLFRGAQPTAKGLAELKKAGVTIVVDLRQEGLEVEHERKLAESLGLHFLNIPIVGWSLPSDAQVAQFLSLFRDPAAPLVFVHCYYGDDRTGVMVATYRIAQQHWTAEQAAHEMRFFGFHYYLYPNMASYVRKFPAQFASSAAFAPLRTVPIAEPAAKQL